MNTNDQAKKIYEALSYGDDGLDLDHAVNILAAITGRLIGSLPKEERLERLVRQAQIVAMNVNDVDSVPPDQRPKIEWRDRGKPQ